MTGEPHIRKAGKDDLGEAERLVKRGTARVSGELGNGRVLTREAAIVHGDAANSRPRHELEAKFRALASEALDAARANEVVEMVARLEHLPDIRGLTALLTTGPRS